MVSNTSIKVATSQIVVTGRNTRKYAAYNNRNNCNNLMYEYVRIHINSALQGFIEKTLRSLRRYGSHRAPLSGAIPTQSPFPRARIQPAAISERLGLRTAFPAQPHRIEPHPRQRGSYRVLEGGEK
jgi:hypothetical protein